MTTDRTSDRPTCDACRKEPEMVCGKCALDRLAEMRAADARRRRPAGEARGE